MKLRLLAIIILASLLGGCGLAELTTQEKIAAVRDKAVELCGYLPKPGSVAAMLAAANPTVVSVGAVAAAICREVTLWNSGDRPSFAMSCPKVNDVCIQGEFIKPKRT